MPAMAYTSLSRVRRLFSAPSAPTLNLLMEPLSPCARTRPSATIEARVRVPPPSTPRTTFILQLLQSPERRHRHAVFRPARSNCHPSLVESGRAYGPARDID